jgi:TatD DNase family protein
MLATFIGCDAAAQIHVHCFTDTPDFAQRLLDHFANLYIGITGALPSGVHVLISSDNPPGVITFSSNENTSNLVRRMFAQSPGSPAHRP